MAPKASEDTQHLDSVSSPSVSGILHAACAALGSQYDIKPSFRDCAATLQATRKGTLARCFVKGYSLRFDGADESNCGENGRAGAADSQAEEHVGIGCSKARAIAFMSGLHERMGAKSALKIIDAEVARDILRASKVDRSAQALLWEISLLQVLKGHENIPCVQEVVSTFSHVFLISKAFDTDMERILASPMVLTDHHVQYFIYNVLRGLKFLHSAGLVHGSIQPKCILLNSDEDVIVSDLHSVTGAGTIPSGSSPQPMWYQAPELLLGTCPRHPAMDMWSTGCVLAEMMQQKPVRPMFEGDDRTAVLNRQLQWIDARDPDELAHLPPTQRTWVAEHASAAVANGGFDLREAYTAAGTAGVDLLWSFLRCNPAHRVSAEQALAHAYLCDLHLEEDEPFFAKDVDFAALARECFSATTDEVRAGVAQTASQISQRR